VLQVCLVHVGGLTPIRGGGIGSVILNMVKSTGDKIHYTLVADFNRDDFLEAKSAYPSSVQIVGLKSSNNVALGFAQYLANSPHTGFDVVHFHDFPMGRELPFAMKTYLKKCRLVYSYHVVNEFFTAKGRLTRGAYYSLFRCFGRVWKRVVVNSKFMLDDLRRLGDYSGKIVIIPNGVNVEEIRNASEVDLLGTPSFLFVGHLEYGKGVDILLAAFRNLQRRIKGAHLHLVGSGSMESYCKGFVSKHHQQNVHFWGSANVELTRRLLRSCDICVLPSRYEAFGIVLLEAMAAGKPIISTKVGGIPEIVTDQRNGLLVEPEQGQLAQAMEILCTRKDLVEEFSDNNCIDVGRYSWQAIGQEYIRLYNSVANDVGNR